MSNECWLDEKVWKKRAPKEQHDWEERQCCCNCIFHLEDKVHPCTDHDAYYGNKDHHKGWICAIGLSSEWSDPNEKPIAFSGWDEHSIGCELHTSKEKFRIHVTERK